MKTKRETIHEKILLRAEEIGNAQYIQQYPAKPLGSHPLRRAQVQSNHQGFTMDFDEDQMSLLPIEQRKEVSTALRKMAVASIHQSIVENGDAFVGLLMGMAKQGKSYTHLLDLDND